LAALDEALTLVEKMGERYYEAELHHQRGKARALLAPIYGWFTEGFDTADCRRPRRC
jgi:hypothetical protein